MQASASASAAGDGRHLAAIVFADLAGYSRLMAADEVETYARWSGFYDTVLKAEGERLGGQISDLRGDEVLLEFASVLNAVKWARAVHAAAAATSRGRQAGPCPARGDLHGRDPLSPARAYSATR